MKKSQRLENVTLIIITVLVGIAAGWASFSHVKEWTMDNSPSGTSDFFGWSNAVIADLVPVASLLVMRRLRKQNRPTWFPWCTLLGGLFLSIAAQLAVAVQTPSGWLLSVVPAVAFICLTKLVLSATSDGRKPARRKSVVPQEPTYEVPRKQAELPPQDVQNLDALSNGGTNGKRKRMPVEETRALIRELEDQNPGITRKQLAEQIGVSDRRIRQVLSNTNAVDAESVPVSP